MLSHRTKAAPCVFPSTSSLDALASSSSSFSLHSDFVFLSFSPSLLLSSSPGTITEALNAAFGSSAPSPSAFSAPAGGEEGGGGRSCLVGESSKASSSSSSPPRGCLGGGGGGVGGVSKVSIGESWRRGDLYSLISSLLITVLEPILPVVLRERIFSWHRWWGRTQDGSYTVILHSYPRPCTSSSSFSSSSCYPYGQRSRLSETGQREGTGESVEEFQTRRRGATGDDGGKKVEGREQGGGRREEDLVNSNKEEEKQRETEVQQKMTKRGQILGGGSSSRPSSPPSCSRAAAAVPPSSFLSSSERRISLLRFVLHLYRRLRFFVSHQAFFCPPSSFFSCVFSSLADLFSRCSRKGRRRRGISREGEREGRSGEEQREEEKTKEMKDGERDLEDFVVVEGFEAFVVTPLLVLPAPPPPRQSAEPPPQ